MQRANLYAIILTMHSSANQEKNTCLVTGSSGFVGRHLVAALKNKGHNVVEFSRHEHGNLHDEKTLADFFKKQRFDYIFHLASPSAQSDPATDIEFNVNVLGTYRLLRLAAQYPVKGFINVGTSLEYGEHAEPMREDMALKPRFLHAGTKAAATMLAVSMAHQFNIPLIHARPFSLYGPAEVRPRFMPVLIRACLEGTPLTLHPGLHDWLYIDDFINAIIMLSTEGQQWRGEVFNIGSGVETENATVATLVEKLTRKKLNLVRAQEKYRPYDTAHWVADTTKLKSAIAWNPLPLEEGLRRTIAAFAQ